MKTLEVNNASKHYPTFDLKGTSFKIVPAK